MIFRQEAFLRSKGVEVDHDKRQIIIPCKKGICTKLGLSVWGAIDGLRKEIKANKGYYHLIRKG